MADHDAVQDSSSLQEQTGTPQTSGEPTAGHPGTATNVDDTQKSDVSVLHRSVRSRDRQHEPLQYSPHYKLSKVDQMSEFLKTRFLLSKDSKVLKSRVVDVAKTEYDERAAPHVIGRAIVKAFGAKIRPHGRSVKDEYNGLKEIETEQTTTAVSSLQLMTQPDANIPQSSSQRKRERSVASPDTPTRPSQPKQFKESVPLPSPTDKTSLPTTQTSTPPTRVSRIPVRFKDFVFKGKKKKKVPAGHSKIPTLMPAKSMLHTRTRTTQTDLEYGASFTISTVRHRSVIKPKPKPYHSADSDAENPYNVIMNVSVDEVYMLGIMRKNAQGLLQYMKRKKLYTTLDSSTVQFTMDKIRGEVMAYATKPDCILKRVSAGDMEAFSLAECWEEFQEQVPTLVEVIVAASSRKDQHNMTNKTLNSVNPAITLTIAKCLSIYSNHLSASRTYVAIILSNGGLTDTCMNRMAKLYDTVTHQNLIKKLNDLAKRHKVSLAQLGNQYCVVLDNVDIYVKPRRETKDKSNTMHHMVQAIAVEERVQPPPSVSRVPSIPVADIEPEDVYPTVDDGNMMKQLMYWKVVEILKEMPALKGVPLNLPSKRHLYTAEMSRKSKQVNLGVLQKNENIKEDLLFCLEQYHSLVLDTGDDTVGVLQYKFCIGDYLTFERGQQVQSTQSDGRTPADRLEGLLMGMADFHVQMNFLKLIYRVLFQSDSQPSPGTLTHAKDFLNARNVVADASKRYYDCGAMFDKVFHAYIFTAGINELGLESIDQPRTSITSTDVEKAANSIVAKYTDLRPPNLKDKGKLRCKHCRTKYGSVKNLRTHHKSEHPNIAWSEDNSHGDAVFNHTVMTVTLGLLRLLHNQAIQWGNGDQIILLYKYMYMIFKANGAFKYGCGILETVIQTKILPGHLSFRLTWNRFYNSHSRRDTNIPLDLQLEHENANFKRRLKTYRGTFTQSHLDRISQGREVINKMIRHMDKEIGFRPPVSRSSRELPMKDIRLLVASYTTEDLLDVIGVRTHSPSMLSLTGNPISGINGKSLREWMVTRITKCRIRHYYRQFDVEPASFESQSDEEYPDLANAWWETDVLPDI